MIAIIDYDAGNINSVEKAFRFLGEDVLITNDEKKIAASDKVVLPGVGSFGDAMKNIRRFGLDETIKKEIKEGKPFLGICLGLQLLFSESVESPGEKGLGIFEGEIVRIPDKEGFKIPHIGWNSLDLKNDGSLFKGMESSPYVYFVHSYFLRAKDRSIVKATCDYTCSMDVSIQSENVFACQFHPEKSGKMGLAILKNFAGMD